MKEKNRTTLRNALGRLPQYDPPAGAWGAIGRNLNPELGDRLPSYQPPAAVWNGLAAQLNEATAEAGERQQSLFSLNHQSRRWLGIAASLLLVVSLSFGIASRSTGPKITYSYGKAAAPAVSLLDFDTEEESFNNVMAQLEQIDQPDLNTLRVELKELNAAKEEIKTMLENYGKDPQVIRQLAEIERERSDVYRRIISRL